MKLNRTMILWVVIAIGLLFLVYAMLSSSTNGSGSILMGPSMHASNLYPTSASNLSLEETRQITPASSPGNDMYLQQLYDMSNGPTTPNEVGILPNNTHQVTLGSDGVVSVRTSA